MTSLTLHFTSRGSSVSLIETEFFGLSLKRPCQSIRGRTTPAVRNLGTFGWTSAVRALAILFVDHALSCYTKHESGSLKGENGSMAATLDFSISKQPVWLGDMFGLDSDGVSNIRRIVRRINPERKRPGPVEIFVNSTALPSDKVRIYLDGIEVVERSNLELIDRSLRANANAEFVLERTTDDSHESDESLMPAAIEQPQNTDQENQATTHYEVVFVLTVPISHPYYAELLDCCNRKFDQILGRSVRIVTRAVFAGDDFKPDSAIAALMRETESFSARTLALVVVPIFSNGFTEVLASVAERFKLPIIALTVPFHDDAPFVSRNMPIPALIISDNQRGARELGAHAANFLFSAGILKGGRFLLVPGSNERADSTSRLGGFVKGVREVMPKAEFATIASCEWNRTFTYERILNYFADSSVAQIDLIFAANDQMALGVRDALVAMGSKGNYNHRLPFVCGYDAIEEVRRLILLNDPLFIGSVDQALSLMAEKLALKVKELRDGTPVAQSLGEHSQLLIPPQIIFNQLLKASNA